MRLRGGSGALVALVGVQPIVEHSDRIIETVGEADRYEA
jgi:hypothetical protein